MKKLAYIERSVRYFKIIKNRNLNPQLAILSWNNTDYHCNVRMHITPLTLVKFIIAEIVIRVDLCLFNNRKKNWMKRDESGQIYYV